MAVDELSQDFLRVLLEYGGDADTSTIRSETGMTRGQVNHRFKKLEGYGWIDISRAESGKGERTPPKVAVLTDEGEQAIKTGDAGKQVMKKEEEHNEESIEISKEQLEEFNSEIDGMKNRLNVVVEQLHSGGLEESEEEEVEGGFVEEERMRKLEREVNRLRETVELLNEAVSEQRKANVSAEVEEQDEVSGTEVDDEVIQELRDQQEYLQEWMDVAQRHMIAMRLYMGDNDEDFDEYLQMAEERQNRGN